SRPRLPSGFSRLCSGPAPKPSSETENPATRTFAMTAFPDCHPQSVNQQPDGRFGRPDGSACPKQKNRRFPTVFEGRLERAKGFEPSTPTLARLCSTPELRPLSGPVPARVAALAGRGEAGA